jgi:hypothetical protein
MNRKVKDDRRRLTFFGNRQLDALRGSNLDRNSVDGRPAFSAQQLGQRDELRGIGSLACALLKRYDPA